MSEVPGLDFDSSFEDPSVAFDWTVNYVKQRLGFPIVGVELDEEANIKLAIGDALRMFNKWSCEAQLRVAYSQTDAVVIQLEDSVRGILEVKILFPETQRQTARINIFEIIYRMVFPKFPIADWYLYRSFYDMFQEVRGTEPDWRWDSFSKKLYLDCWSGPYDIFYVVAKDLTLTTFYTGKKPYLQDFLDLVVARAKMILARTLSKFGSIPSPSGTISTDADSLRREAEATEKQVVEALQKRSRFSMVGMLG